MSDTSPAAYLAEMFSLDGRVALVTGGTSGIGEMIAEGLVRAGATTYVASRKPDACEQVAERLSAQGTCRPLPGDLGSVDGCTVLADDLRSHEDRLDVLVNAAGATWGAPLEEYPDRAWDKVLELNVKSVFNLTVALLEQLRAGAEANPPARVLNVGSVHGFVAPPFESYAYTASKAAVHQLTRHLAKHLGPQDVRVNAIAPGPFPSRMMAATIDAIGDELVSETSTGRLGEPHDMAGIAVYLASRAGENVNGAVIPVDGGYGILR